MVVRWEETYRLFLLNLLLLISHIFRQELLKGMPVLLLFNFLPSRLKIFLLLLSIFLKNNSVKTFHLTKGAVLGFNFSFFVILV
jgi:hypothetical protein